jgi:hypothetical protein
MPLVGSLANVIPGALIEPSMNLKGTSIPPLPLRESESVSAAATSGIVLFAQSASMVSCAMTGLPDGSE